MGDGMKDLVWVNMNMDEALQNAVFVLLMHAGAGEGEVWWHEEEHWY